MTAINIDEDLAIEESPWRGRIITLVVLVVIAAIVALISYRFFFSDSTPVTRATEDIPVKRATINQTLIISGVADAQFNSNLTFQSAGKVAAVNVRVGETVSEGQVLATLQSDDLSNAVATARANQQAAQLKLDKLLEGSTAAELAASDQTLAAADAALTKAQDDYDDLVDGASAADVAGAEQAVRLAESQLATATSARDKLQSTPSESDRSSAEAAVASALSLLTAAQNSATNAQNTVSSASASLKSSEKSYCDADTAPAFCGGQAAPISGNDATLMNNALSGTHASLASGVIAANTVYLNATNGAASAVAAVVSAQDAVNAAQAKLDLVNQGPTGAERDAADAAVTSAQAALQAADEKLRSVQQGATDFQLSTALAAVNSANAAFVSAQAKRDESYRGPDANTIAQARQAVASAQLAIEAAQIRLKNAQIIAPFDGVVASVNAKPGEFASISGGTTTAAPIVLVTPDALTLKISVGETDYGNLKRDQGGIAFFDGIPGKPYPFKVTEIGLSPTVTQGVVTYEVHGSLTLLPGSPHPAPGMNARGQIVTDSKPDVVVVPPRAIRRRGADQLVDVRRNGNVEEQIITTGATNDENVEILTGLQEGDVVVVASLTTKPGTSGAKSQPTLPSGVR